jgi:hypothetical protein
LAGGSKVLAANVYARQYRAFQRTNRDLLSPDWNPATCRLPHTAHEAPFLLPVVIDVTHESQAGAQEDFLRLQWGEA